MNIKIGLLLLAVASTMVLLLIHKRFSRYSHEPEILEAYVAFKSEFKKSYSSENENYRYMVFRGNYKTIQAHNANKSNTWEMGVNQFSDLTRHEFKKRYLMNGLPPKPAIPQEENTQSTYDASIPNESSIDWRQKGGVSRIKDQGSCGSCWAFSTTGAVESAYLIYKKQSVLLSEQQLIDCCGAEGYSCGQCMGSWPEYAFLYVSARGLTTEAAYPYKASAESCKGGGGEYKISTFRHLPAGSMKELMQAIQKQPVSVGVEAEHWQHYKKGIFSGCGQDLDHAVLLVGYDPSYWTIKNSYSQKWGENGYIRLAPGPTCGLPLHAIVPIV